VIFYLETNCYSLFVGKNRLLAALRAKLSGPNRTTTRADFNDHMQPARHHFLALLIVIAGCAEEPATDARGGWGGAVVVVTQQVEMQPMIDCALLRLKRLWPTAIRLARQSRISRILSKSIYRLQ
jgi:hypothetical protein